MGRGNYKKKQARIAEMELKELSKGFDFSKLTFDPTDPWLKESNSTQGNGNALFKVQVIHSSLRRRKEPSLRSGILGYISDNGVYDIYEERNGWGKLDDNSWIKLEFTKKIPE